VSECLVQPAHTLGGGWSETDRSGRGGDLVTFALGVDIACRARHQASLAAADGGIVWSGHRFRTDIGGHRPISRINNAAGSHN
jgi:hypothetical protein